MLLFLNNLTNFPFSFLCMLRNRAAQPNWKFSMEFFYPLFSYALPALHTSSGGYGTWVSVFVGMTTPEARKRHSRICRIQKAMKSHCWATQTEQTEIQWTVRLRVFFFFCTIFCTIQINFLHAYLSVRHYKASKIEFAFTTPSLLQSSILYGSAKGTVLRSVLMYPACLVILPAFLNDQLFML